MGRLQKVVPFPAGPWGAPVSVEPSDVLAIPFPAGGDVCVIRARLFAATYRDAAAASDDSGSGPRAASPRLPPSEGGGDGGADGASGDGALPPLRVFVGTFNAGNAEANGRGFLCSGCGGRACTGWVAFRVDHGRAGSPLI